MDASLEKFATRRLEDRYPYLILDARYEKVREVGVIRSRAVLVAIGVDTEGRRQVLAVELAARESTTSWKEFVRGLGPRPTRTAADTSLASAAATPPGPASPPPDRADRGRS